MGLIFFLVLLSWILDLPSIVNQIKRYIYFFFSKEEELKVLLLFPLNIAGLLKAHLVFILKIYVLWPIPSKVSRLIKITSFQSIMSAFKLSSIMCLSVWRGEEMRAELDNVRIVRHLYKIVFVFYCCITYFQNLSDLEQHICIISQFPWVRSLGTA